MENLPVSLTQSVPVDAADCKIVCDELLEDDGGPSSVKTCMGRGRGPVCPRQRQQRPGRLKGQQGAGQQAGKQASKQESRKGKVGVKGGNSMAFFRKTVEGTSK